MMASTLSRAAAAVAGFFFVLSSCSSSSSSNGVMAWQSGTSISRMKMTTPTTTSTTDLHSMKSPSDTGPSPHRRELLSLIPKMAAATVMLSPTRRPAFAAAPAPTLTADAARDQWNSAAAALDDLLQSWSSESEKWAVDVGGGDALRAKLGTSGTSSSLFQIEKAFKALRDSEYVDDFVEFQETADAFMDALFQADSLASSSNNKTGSGSQTPPAVFIEQSKAEVVKMQSIAKKLSAMVLK